MWDFKNWRDVKSVKNGVDRLFNNVGEWVVLLKRDTRFKCLACEEDELCTECFGTGVKTTVYYTPSRIEVITSNRLVDELEIPGYVATRDVSIHLPLISYADVGDILLQCEWNVRASSIKTRSEARPLNVVKAHKIIEKYVPFQTQVSWIKTITESLGANVSFYNLHIQDLFPGQKILI